MIAQGCQESRLDHSAKSLAVGDIRELDSNIHAAVKYMRFMIDQYYNCGPGRMRQLRAEAEREGLDKNRWFGNVERIASKRIGRETVSYVSNIYKYYVAYTLAMENMAAKRGALSQNPAKEN